MKTTKLITEISAEDLAAIVNQFSSTLRTHENLDIVKSHGGLTVVNQAVHDTSPELFDDVSGIYGHKVGRYRVRIKVGEVFYEIPADTNPWGPPRVPKITIQPTSKTSSADEGDPQPQVIFSCAFSATLPSIVTWEVKLNVLGWQPIAINNYYRYGVAVSASDAPYGTSPSWTLDGTTLTNGNASTTTGGSAIFQAVTTTLRINSSSPGEGTYSNVMRIRCKIDNSAIGGGVKYSNEVSLNIQDKTGC